MKFRDAAQSQSIMMGRTFNGMPTFVSSGNPLVDLFSAIGSSRGKDLRTQFLAAYDHDRIKALKILLWGRDVRGGAGERQTVRNLLQVLEETHLADAEMLIPYIPFFGRWDDILVFKTERLRHAAYSVIADALHRGHEAEELLAQLPAMSEREAQATLLPVHYELSITMSAKQQLQSLLHARIIEAQTAAKWTPRKGKIALELEAFLGLRPNAEGFRYSGDKAYPAKAYRHMLSSLTHVVEQQMCAKQWSEIKFDHVPSLAAARYQKAFNRNCADAYKVYKEGLKRGTAKINASAVYPYDVIKSIDHGDVDVARAQWEALPNFLGDESMLAMVDVSGSMQAIAAGNLTNMQVATSLGLYIADKAKGPFQHCFLTFSGSPKIEVLSGDIVSKYRQMRMSHWTMNTNVMGAFMEILKLGKRHDVKDADMPRILLVLSDMEFDSCVSGADDRAMDRLREMYEGAGYTLPRVVFWNLAARPGNSPVTFRENGTASVSGFSPAIMKSILKANLNVTKFTPESVMEETISSPRYDVFREATMSAPASYTAAQAAKTWQVALENRRAAH